MKAGVHLKLKQLKNQPKEFLTLAEDHDVQIRKIKGVDRENNDDSYDVSNIKKLQISEVETLERLVGAVKELIQKQQEL